MGMHLFGHVIWDVTRGQLTQHLNDHIQPLVDETNYGFSQELPACEGAYAKRVLSEYWLDFSHLTIFGQIGHPYLFIRPFSRLLGELLLASLLVTRYVGSLFGSVRLSTLLAVSSRVAPF